MVEHEHVESPNWDTAISCSCGDRCTNWMEFYRHRGNEYKEQAQLQAAMIEAGQGKPLSEIVIEDREPYNLEAELSPKPPRAPWPDLGWDTYDDAWQDGWEQGYKAARDHS